MDWIPVIKLGWWNAWILMLIYPLQPYLLILVDKLIGRGDVLKKMGGASPNPQENRLNRIYMVNLLVMAAYSIFLPLKLGTTWVYAGLTIYLIGLAILLAAMVNAAITPHRQLFSGGVYRYSRHPMYLAQLLLYTGTGIACGSWLFLLLTSGLVYLMIKQIEIEERGCIEIFGESYQEYMRVTPKWLGIPKILHLKQI
jgi:protein-S-isoprenylcysteine O-methyltransferase Ste14